MADPARWGDWDDDEPDAPIIRPRPKMEIFGVTNFDDDVAVSRRLHALTGPGRLIVRPTPGTGPVASMVWDVLAALGKNPVTVRRERLSVDGAWRAAAAWLVADHVTDIVVDRAHRITVSAIDSLTTLADEAGAHLWLIWGATLHVDYIVDRLQRKGRRSVTLVPPDEFFDALPLPIRAPCTVPLRTDEDHPWTDQPWPQLPAADFPVFRAVCRRLIAGDTFHALDRVYRDEFHRARQWIRRRELDGPGADAVLTKQLNAYLRDHRIGPAGDPTLALIRLRAIQAGLMREHVLLSWHTDALGPDPAARLPSQLTERVSAALRTGVDTGPAAATVLSLHLNAPPEAFEHLTLRNVHEHGRYVNLPDTDEQTSQLRAAWAARPENFGAEPVGPGGERVPIPWHAQVILAAHLARRRGEDAPAHAPFLPDARGSDPSSPQLLRETIIRACRRIHLNPGWLHGGNACRHGSDIGRHLAHPKGWMDTRRLKCRILRLDETWRA